MSDAVVLGLTAIGATSMVLAALGLVRMPDVFMRISACAKAATLGVASILLGAAVFFGDMAVVAKAVAVIFFVSLTAPVSGHMIGRAAYRAGAPLWPRTVIDEMQGRYDRGSDTLRSIEPEPVPPSGERSG